MYVLAAMIFFKIEIKVIYICDLNTECLNSLKMKLKSFVEIDTTLWTCDVI